MRNFLSNREATIDTVYGFLDKSFQSVDYLLSTRQWCMDTLYRHRQAL